MKKIIVLSLMLMFTFSPYLALAQTQPQTTSTNPCTVAGVKAATDKGTALPACISQIYTWSLGVAALLALFMSVLGGFYYMTASGNAEQSSKGVEMIWGAVIGLALLFGAYLLLRTINPELVNLKLDLTGVTDICPAGQVPAGPRGSCTAQ